MTHAIQIRRKGGPEVLSWTAVDVGDPQSGRVRLRQAAAGLNYIYVYHRTGYYAQPLPFMPGLEGAEAIEAVGPGGARFADRRSRAYVAPRGGYSDVRLIDAYRLVRLPDAIPFDQTAAMMVQSMTAQVLIRHVYPIKASDWILVHAAAGTGLILCQWAAALGATVICTVSTEATAELAHAHGCSHTTLCTQQDFVAEVDRFSGDEKQPVVLDSVGRDTFHRSIDCLRPCGLMVTFGQSSGPIEPIAPVVFAQKGSLFPTFAVPLHRATRGARSVRERIIQYGGPGTVRIHIQQSVVLKDAA